MSTHNIQFHDKMNFFLSYRKNIIGIQKRVRSSHGKRAIGVRAIEVRLDCLSGKLSMSEQTVKTKTRHRKNAASDLGLHCWSRHVCPNSLR